MNEFIKILVLAILGAILSLIVKRTNPEFSLLISISAGVIVLLYVFKIFSDISSEMRILLQKFSVPNEVFEPIVKCTVISFIARTTAELCKQSGEGALALKVDLAGTLACIAVTMPLFMHVISFIADLMMRV